MKKILIAISLLGLALSGCEKFLDTENLTGKDTSNSPSNEREMNELVTGIYLAAHDMEMESDAKCSFVISEILSDDRFAGGGSDDKLWGDLEKFVVASDPNFLRATWKAAYYTIYRANIVLEGLDNVQNWSSPEARAYTEGQARFFRAYAFWNLARTFGTAPLTLKTAPENLPRPTADEMFAQIAADYTAAISLMPATKLVPERGRATKWAAEAFLTRAWLFYTGYYKKAGMPIAAEDGGQAGEITKAQITAHIDDCIANSGHALLPDFRNLWPYSNKASQPRYPYSLENNLEWIGEGGANVETIFAHTSSPTAVGYDTGQSVGNSNRINLYFSIRTQADAGGTFPYGLGWGFGTVNTQFWNSWPDNDLRKKGSIIDVRDTKEIANYSFGVDNQMHETGYIQKKYISLYAIDADGKVDLMDRVIYGDYVSNDYMLSSTQDLVTMRFADVLLMGAELKEDASLLNRVRARAKLEPVTAYSLTALQNERRWELAFEGLRYYDLLRWGIAGGALAGQNGVSVRNRNIEETMDLGDQAGRLSATGGFMPIPTEEISLSNGVLVQTPGW